MPFLPFISFPHFEVWGNTVEVLTESMFPGLQSSQIQVKTFDFIQLSISDILVNTSNHLTSFVLQGSLSLCYLVAFNWKQRTPLCSRVATGISWSSLCGLKGVKPPEAFGERSRDWSLGHAGDEGPHLRDHGGVSGWFSSGGPSHVADHTLIT